MEARLKKFRETPQLAQAKEQYDAVRAQLKRLQEERGRVVAAGEERAGVEKPTAEAPRDELLDELLEQERNLEEQRELERKQYPEYKTAKGEPLRPRLVEFKGVRDRAEAIEKHRNAIKALEDLDTYPKGSEARAKAEAYVAGMQKRIDKLQEDIDKKTEQLAEQVTRREKAKESDAADAVEDANSKIAKLREELAALRGTEITEIGRAHV